MRTNHTSRLEHDDTTARDCPQPQKRARHHDAELGIDVVGRLVSEGFSPCIDVELRNNATLPTPGKVHTARHPITKYKENIIRRPRLKVLRFITSRYTSATAEVRYRKRNNYPQTVAAAASIRLSCCRTRTTELHCRRQLASRSLRPAKHSSFTVSSIGCQHGLQARTSGARSFDWRLARSH